MKLTYLIFLAVMSVVVITECKPLSDDVDNAPCVDCEQKTVRRKRCVSCLLDILFGRPEYDIPNVYIGNGDHNENHVQIGRANNVYIGNGEYNSNVVSMNTKPPRYSSYPYYYDYFY